MIDIKSNKKNSFFSVLCGFPQAWVTYRPVRAGLLTGAANPPQGAGHPTVASHIPRPGEKSAHEDVRRPQNRNRFSTAC